MKPLLCVNVVFCIERLFSKTFSCTVEHYHGECVHVCVCVRTCVCSEQGDGTGLLLRHVDELPVRYCCHVLSQPARNALTE